MAIATAGTMRHRVTIFAPEGTADATLGAATIIANGVPASITSLPLPFQQAERIGAGGVRGHTSYQLGLRYRDDLQQDFEVREECCTARVFHIVTMIHDDKMEWWELTCQVVA